MWDIQRRIDILYEIYDYLCQNEDTERASAVRYAIFVLEKQMGESK